MEKDEVIKLAHAIVTTCPFTVESYHTEDTDPTDEEVERFENAAHEDIEGATLEELGEVYEEVLRTGDGEEPVAPSTLLCWLGDRVSDVDGLMVCSVNLETDR